MANKISRREFLRIGGVSTLGLFISACGDSVTPTSKPVSQPPESPRPFHTSTLETMPIREPECEGFLDLISMPQVSGERYFSHSPDTLDLQEKAKSAINALTRCTSPRSNYDVLFYGDMRRNPPVLYRRMPFYGKFWEALGLMRYLTGSSLNSHVDQYWRKLFLDWFQHENPLLDGPDGGRLLCWIGNNYYFEKNPCWLKIAEMAVNNLQTAFVHEGDYCFLLDNDGKMATGWDATFRGWTLQGLVRLYTATCSNDALTLASKLARYLKDHALVFDSNGRFLARHPSDNGPALHFHHNGNTMVALSEYALATQDLEFASFVKKGYEYAISIGWPIVGFFPEYIHDWPDSRSYIDCETCCTVDMIMLAINLSLLGVGDYWDDVDRFVRNQFDEMQMKSGEWIKHIAETYPSSPVGNEEEGDLVAERVVGSFSGWALTNDFIASDGEPFVSGCCTGNGVRAIAYVWDKMLEYEKGRMKIHLLFNRPSPWAEINSCIPYEGRIDVIIKVPLDLQIRIPEWTKTEEIKCTVNGHERGLTFQGRYAQIGPVDAGQMATITFPINEHGIDTTIGDLPYSLIVKGNDVVEIQPPGQRSPFYQRAKYRENKARWVNRERFIRTE